MGGNGGKSWYRRIQQRVRKRQSLRKRHRIRAMQAEVLEDRRLLSITPLVVTTANDVVDPDDGLLSLREAVTVANQDPADYEIILEAGTTYTLSILGQRDDDNLSGDLDIDSTAGNLTIRAEGDGFATIDADRIDRVFHIVGDGTATVEFVNLVVRGGLSLDSGGGILADHSGEVIFTDSIVEDNVARDDGGGLQAEHAHVTLVGSTFRNNLSDDDGGGLDMRHGDLHVIAGSSFVDNRTQDEAGAFRVRDGNVLVRDSFIIDNIAGDGAGGFRADLGDVTVVDSTISGNIAGHRGGGMRVMDGDLTITGSTITDNRAGREGGGVWHEFGNLALTDTVVQGNWTGREGGGIWADRGDDVTLLRSTVDDNRAGREGGGIWADHPIITLIESTVSHNRSTVGGGIFTYEKLIMRNSTISGNLAGTEGGGAWVDREVDIVNSTIAFNRAVEGGGIFFDGSASRGQVGNTIIAGNEATSGPDVRGSFTSLGHNLIGAADAGQSGFGDGVESDQVGTSAEPIDARLAPLDDYGGPTRTHNLFPDSPAIDVGDDDLAIGAGLVTDQRGFNRFVDGTGDDSAVVDIGAVEFDPAAIPPDPPPPDEEPEVNGDDSAIFVTTTADVVDPDDGLISLREAITMANQEPGDNEIVLQAGITYTLSILGQEDDDNLSGDLDIDSAAGNLTIRAEGDGLATIDARDIDRVVHIVGSGTATVEFVNLIITGGLHPVDGGGVRADHQGEVIFTNSIVEYNIAGNDGGGIFSRDLDRAADVRLIGSSVRHNLSGDDGGAGKIPPAPVPGVLLPHRRCRRNRCGSLHR